jgi:hypothetical protein
MFIKDIVALINTNLADEMLSYYDLRPFLDRTIDDINTKLNSTYPTFTEQGNIDAYNAFPDKYLRSVVALGAAWYYYVADEEGSPTALQLGSDYNNHLLLMQRDMLYNVPLQYQADSLQGTMQSPFENTWLDFNNTLGEC